MQASCEVALEIAKQKNSYDCRHACETLFAENRKTTAHGEEASEAKMRRIYFSKDRPIIQRLISDMSEDATDQVILQKKQKHLLSPMFLFQADESTNVTSCAQLLVVVRYIHSRDFKQEFLFCEELQTITSADVLEKIKTFLILQSCSGNMFAGFVLMEFLQWWHHVQAFQQVQELALEAEGKHHGRRKDFF